MDSGSDAMEGSDFDGSFSDFDDDENTYFSSGDEEKEDEEDENRMDSEGTFFIFFFVSKTSLNNVNHPRIA